MLKCWGKNTRTGAQKCAPNVSHFPVTAAMTLRRGLICPATMGFAVLRFDFKGLGHSRGEFQNTNFTSNVADLYAAVTALTARDMAPSMLIGHSLGGAAVLKAAANLDQIKAVVTLGAPADPSHAVHNFGTSLDEIAVNGKAEVTLSGRPFTISHDFVHQTVGIENASQIFVAAKHPKSFVTLDNANHFISDVDDAEYAADVIAA